MIEIKQIPPGNWIVNHFAYIWSGLLNGWYQERNFIILDHLPKNKNTTNVVYFPDIPELYNAKLVTDIYRKDTLRDNLELYIKRFPESYYKYLENDLLVCKKYEYDKNVINNFITDLKTIIKTSLPFKSIHIATSYFGTRGSYFLHRYDQRLEMVFRSDQNLSGVFKLILRTVIQQNYSLNQNQMTFETEEHIVYHYLTKTKLAKYLEMYPHEPLINKLTSVNQDPELLNISKEYLNKLGVINNSEVSLDGFGNVLINSRKLIMNGNKGKLLKLLIKNKGKVCTFDEITDELYGNIYEVDKFSIQYITKLVEETRKYLATKGFAKNLITTVRGEGYLVY